MVTRKRYTKEFKFDAICIVMETTSAALSRNDMNIKKNTIQELDGVRALIISAGSRTLPSPHRHQRLLSAVVPAVL